MRQIVLFLSLVAFISCKNKPDFLKSFGPTQTETRQLEKFETLELGFNTEVELTQDSSKPVSIEITYGKNMLPKIETKVINNTLYIKDKNTFNWVRKLEVRLKCKLNVHSMRTINIHGVADIRSSQVLKFPFLDIVSDGVGIIDLNVDAGILTLNTKNPGTSIFKGHADIFSFSLENGHGVDASQLSTDDVYAFHYSSRDCFVKANKKMGVSLFANGNLYYSINPTDKFETNAKGKGKVIFNP